MNRQQTTRLPEPDEVRIARKVMEDHYREPVRPVSHYCERLASYADALDHAIQNHDPATGGCGPFQTIDDAITVRDGLRLLDMWRWKSNALGRLIYGDEPLRTQPCPRHEGRWSGCKEGGYCECQYGHDVTGWLPDE